MTTIQSSHGQIHIHYPSKDKQQLVYALNDHTDPDSRKLLDIVWFDIPTWEKRYNETADNWNIDILEVGYKTITGHFEPPAV